MQETFLGILVQDSSHLEREKCLEVVCFCCEFLCVFVIFDM